MKLIEPRLDWKRWPLLFRAVLLLYSPLFLPSASLFRSLNTQSEWERERERERERPFYYMYVYCNLTNLTNSDCLATTKERRKIRGKGNSGQINKQSRFSVEKCWKKWAYLLCTTQRLNSLNLINGTMLHDTFPSKRLKTEATNFLNFLKLLATSCTSSVCQFLRREHQFTFCWHNFQQITFAYFPLTLVANSEENDLYTRLMRVLRPRRSQEQWRG